MSCDRIRVIIIVVVIIIIIIIIIVIIIETTVSDLLPKAVYELVRPSLELIRGREWSFIIEILPEAQCHWASELPTLDIRPAA